MKLIDQLNEMICALAVRMGSLDGYVIAMHPRTYHALCEERESVEAVPWAPVSYLGLLIELDDFQPAGQISVYSPKFSLHGTDLD